nr:alpha/beta hydrolase [Devosia sp. 1566]
MWRAGKARRSSSWPGWPQTWWAFHEIMPKLAESHRVIAVDIRGMGASDKPEGGYDKKNMAQDIYELIQSLGLEKVHIVGHDIGGHIAYPFSVLYPEATLSTTYLDVGGLPASTSQMTLLPPQVLSGEFRKDFLIWWFAFHQVHGMPEQLIEGRAHIYLDWFWDSLLYHQDAITEFDRAVYANAYNTPAAIRAGDGWYQAYPQDLIDNASFPEKSMSPRWASVAWATVCWLISWKIGSPTLRSFSLMSVIT